MRLASATVGPFKSISNAQTVTLDQITVFVGMNEAGNPAPQGFLGQLRTSAESQGLPQAAPRCG